MNVYEELRSVLDSHPTTAPESPKILEILEILFTPDEASLAAKMSYKPWPIEKIAKTGAITEAEAEKLLESMANKGILFSKKKEGKKLYGLVPLIPGIFEFPFHENQDGYFSDGKETGRALGGIPSRGPGRVIFGQFDAAYAGHCG